MSGGVIAKTGSSSEEQIRSLVDSSPMNIGGGIVRKSLPVMLVCALSSFRSANRLVVGILVGRSGTHIVLGSSLTVSQTLALDFRHSRLCKSS